MKKLVLLFALLCVLASASAAHAVTLQQGWYAWFGGVWMQRYNPYTGQDTYREWFPSTSLGQSGPVAVTLWAGYPSTRMVTVSADTSVSSGVLFEDAGNPLGGNDVYYLVSGSWGTNYDATKMRLQLLHRRVGQVDELLWQQALSGHQTADVGNIWSTGGIMPGDRLVFQVVAIPEPMSIVTLTFGISTLCWQLRRRKG